MSAAHRHGYLVLDKPRGWTSHDVVARVRRIVGERRVGHAGTLDPAATGVLPIAVGNATRTLEYLADASKTYLAEITLGVETDSYDADGAVVATVDPSQVTQESIEQHLAAFRGTITQLPPMYSAIHVDGKRLYELARQGKTVERTPRQITVCRLEIEHWQPPVVSLVVDCSKGTYVRSLAHDLGRALGVGGMLSNLTRTRSGPFHLTGAMTLAELEHAMSVQPWAAIAYHPDVAAQHLPAATLSVDQSRRWKLGQALDIEPTSTGVHRVYDEAGTWVGMGLVETKTRRIKPMKVVLAT